MTTTFTRRIVTTLALSLAVASLTLGSLPANAGGFSLSFGMGGGDAGMSMAHGSTMGMIARKSHRDIEWDQLDREHASFHLRIVGGGLTEAQKLSHDCLRVREIKAFLKDLRINLAQYEFRQAEFIEHGKTRWAADLQPTIESQADEVKRWERELKKAERDCLV